MNFLQLHDKSKEWFQALIEAYEPDGVEAFFGTWPGDETDQELLDMLKEIE